MMKKNSGLKALWTTAHELGVCLPSDTEFSLLVTIERHSGLIKTAKMLSVLLKDSFGVNLPAGTLYTTLDRMTEFEWVAKNPSGSFLLTGLGVGVTARAKQYYEALCRLGKHR